MRDRDFEPATRHVPKKSRCAVWCPYIRLLVVWLASIFCGGVSPGMSLFIPMFAENGLFGGTCGGQVPCKAQYILLTNMFTVVGSVASLGFIFAGLIFDLVGGRVCACVGALGVSASAVLLAIGLTLSSSIITTIAVLMMDSFNLINVGAFNGLMWHMPEAQGLLFSVACGSAQTAAILPNILQIMMGILGVSLEGVLVWYAIATAVCALILFFTVPTQAEFLARATFVLGIPVSLPRHTWRAVVNAIEMGFRVLIKQRADVLMIACSSGVSIAAGVPYFLQLVPFGTALFGQKEIGEELAAFQTRATTVLSVVAAVAAGYLLDNKSLSGVVAVMCLLLIVIVLLDSVVSYYAQALCILAQACNLIVVPAVLSRFVALWAPSHRFGMVSGLVLGCHKITVASSIMLFTMTSAMFSGTDAFTTPTSIFGVLGLAGLAATASRLSVRHYRTILLAGDEEELMEENFGLKTFEDAENVLRIKREEILRILSSQDLSERRKLIDIMKDEEVQKRWAQRSYQRGYELPDLDPMDYMNLMVTDLERTLSGFFCCTNETGTVTPRPNAANRKTPRGKGRY